MVNVTHNANDGCALQELILGILCLVEELFLDADHDLGACLNAKLVGNEGGGVVIDDLVDGGHDAHEHQLLDHLTCGDHETGGQLADHDLLGQLDVGGLYRQDGCGSGACLAASVLALLTHLCLGRECSALAALVILLLELLRAALHCAGVTVGHEGVQTLVVLGKIHRGGVRVDDARPLQRAVGIEVRGCSANDGLRLEGVSRCGGRVVPLIVIKASAAVLLGTALLTACGTALGKSTRRTSLPLCKSALRCARSKSALRVALRCAGSKSALRRAGSVSVILCSCLRRARSVAAILCVALRCAGSKAVVLCVALRCAGRKSALACTSLCKGSGSAACRTGSGLVLVLRKSVLLRAVRISGIGLTGLRSCGRCGRLGLLLCNGCRSGFCLLFCYGSGRLFCLLLCGGSGGRLFLLFGHGSGRLFCLLLCGGGSRRLFLLFRYGSGSRLCLFLLGLGCFLGLGLFGLFDLGGNIAHPIQIVADVDDLVFLGQLFKQKVELHGLERLLRGLGLDAVLGEDLHEILALHAEVLCKLCDLELLIDSHISS